MGRGNRNRELRKKRCKKKQCWNYVGLPTTINRKVGSIRRHVISEFSVRLHVAEWWTLREDGQMKGNGLNDEVLIMMLMID